jgi:hypothetical protein
MTVAGGKVVPGGDCTAKHVVVTFGARPLAVDHPAQRRSRGQRSKRATTMSGKRNMACSSVDALRLPFAVHGTELIGGSFGIVGRIYKRTLKTRPERRDKVFDQFDSGRINNLRLLDCRRQRRRLELGE